MRWLRGDRGLAPALLVVVVAWALAAVLMLTGTLLAAQTIDGRVNSIVHSTSAIDHDLDAVRLAGGTARISSGILTAAKPLSHQLDEVIVTAKGIDRTAGSIRRTARSIRGNVIAIKATAGSINSTVTSIRSTVGSIESTAGSIASKAGSISSRVDGIDANAHSIRGNARSINDRVRAVNNSVGSIGSRLRATLTESRKGIDPGVAGINIREMPVIRRVGKIKGDFDDILNQVGPPQLAHGHEQPGGDRSIDGHAKSIDCKLRGRHCPQ